MNYLGIDYGQSKIGLAKASSETKIATPFKIIKNNPDIISEISQIVKNESVGQIIVGWPLSLSGQMSEQTKAVESFISLLKKLGKPIHKQDERLTTKSAIAAKDDDSSAAALILQIYLDRSEPL